MVGEGGGVLEPDLVHLVRGGENAAERASAYLLLGVDGDLAVALQAATGVVRGTHLGALEVGGELVHSYGSDELHLACVVVNRASAVARMELVMTPSVMRWNERGLRELCHVETEDGRDASTRDGMASSAKRTIMTSCEVCGRSVVAQV